MWPSRLEKKLQKIIGKNGVLERAQALRCYDFGDEANCPSLVCRPQNGAQVAAIIREAIASDAIISSGISPRQSRPVSQGKKSIWIDFSEMNPIIEIDANNPSAVLHPGSTIAELNALAEKQGLCLPAHPAATLARDLLGTSIVTGLKAVLPSGRLAN